MHICRSVPTDTFRMLVVILLLTSVDFGNGMLAVLQVYLTCWL